MSPRRRNRLFPIIVPLFLFATCSILPFTPLLYNLVIYPWRVNARAPTPAEQITVAPRLLRDDLPWSTYTIHTTHAAAVTLLHQGRSANSTDYFAGLVSTETGA
ncbi:MAG: hypothetical protein MI924_05065, partial [Chloroflexales bacterium]|nr:hypothetical protein [Chloroflexales bacterium]